MPQCQQSTIEPTKNEWGFPTIYRYPTKNWFLLSNSQGKPFLIRMYKMDSETHSLLRLKSKLFYNIFDLEFKFRFFWTLTFRNENDASGTNLRKFLNWLKITWKRSKFWSPITLHDYVWRFEKGKKNGRWHVHMLTNFYIRPEWRKK
jgi:hypothetical protein